MSATILAQLAYGMMISDSDLKSSNPELHSLVRKDFGKADQRLAEFSCHLATTPTRVGTEAYIIAPLISYRHAYADDTVGIGGMLGLNTHILDDIIRVACKNLDLPFIREKVNLWLTVEYVR